MSGGPILFTPPFKTLVTGVADYFEEQGITCVVARGWKARKEQINQGPGRANRVVFMGSKPDGSAGEIVNPRQSGDRLVGGDSTTDPPTPPSHAVRALADWSRDLQVSVWAYDGDNKNDEGAQDDALYQLFTLVQRAVQSIAFGNAVWGGVKITVPGERPFGLELIADLSFQHMISDLPEELARPLPAVIKGSLP